MNRIVTTPKQKMLSVDDMLNSTFGTIEAQLCELGRGLAKYTVTFTLPKVSVADDRKKVGGEIRRTYGAAGWEVDITVMDDGPNGTSTHFYKYKVDLVNTLIS